jgi:hypothetical protein
MTFRSALTALVAVGALTVAVPTYADDAPRRSGDARAISTPTPTPRAAATATPTPRANPTATPTPPARPTATPTPPAGRGDNPAAATPVPGESVVVETPAGTVTVRTPSGQAVDLSDGAEIPVGSTIDATDGTIELHTARPDGTVDTGTFGGGAFVLRQDSRTGYTDLYLRGGSFTRCGASPRRTLAMVASTKPKGKAVRKLWGSDDGGRFRTHGRNSVATVRGTRWLTEDRCSGTLTRVTQGVVDVRDKRTKRTVTVRAGHSYLARAR